MIILIKEDLGSTGITSVVDLFEQIITKAVNLAASDIHLESTTNNLRVRYRLDGILKEIICLPLNLQAQLVSHIKIMSNLDIAEKRLPQDGRLKLKDKPNLDIRVSTLPTIMGEKVVLRLLDQQKQPLDIESLALSTCNKHIFKELYSNSYGMILLTGPTGSGKTTTLYSALSEINTIDKNIVTIEDPVEYYLPNINQVQVNQKAGLDFANGLRGILRQDPDIILVGEIRDTETASIAVRAALTGHLVLSTLHTNNALGAIPRLADMGIENYLLAASLIGVVSQRLVRKVCPQCATRYYPSKLELQSIIDLRGSQLKNFEDINLLKGSGCIDCNFTGYSGRLAIQEVLKITPDLREAIVQGKSKAELDELVKKNEYCELLQDGIKKVLTGQTTFAELQRVAYNIID